MCPIDPCFSYLVNFQITKKILSNLQQAQKSKVAENKSFPEIICTIFFPPKYLLSKQNLFFFTSRKKFKILILRLSLMANSF